MKNVYPIVIGLLFSVSWCDNNNKLSTVIPTATPSIEAVPISTETETQSAALLPIIPKSQDSVLASSEIAGYWADISTDSNGIAR